MKTIDKVKNHFEEEARVFDGIIRKLIPYYSEMTDGMVAAIPYKRTDVINVIDLGCGTGTISRKIKQAFPNAMITCLDLAENMIEMSKLKLKQYKDMRYRVADFSSYEFDADYDVVVSEVARNIETGV